MKPARQILEQRATVSGGDEDAFFAKLRLPNGTFKTTGHGRLVELDRWLASRVEQRDIRVLDVAVSSGVTTVDLIGALRTAGITPEVTACDLCVTAYIRRVSPWLEVLLDSQGHVLQLVTPMFVKGRPHDPQGSVARSALASAFGAAEWMCGKGKVLPQSGDRQVELVSRRLKECGEVEVVEHDLFVARAEWNDRFDIVRAANILNRDYFDEAQLARIVRHLGSYLRDGGLLLVARTDEANETTASLFAKVDGHFTLRERYGSGSWVEQVVIDAHKART